MDIPADLLAKMDEAISHYPVSKRSASLPLLHLWQEHHGFVSDEAIAWIAAKLELQPINILELVTFYPMFRRQPAGRKHIRICRTLSCALAGAYELRERVAKAAGIDLAAFEAEQKKTIVHGHPHNPGHGNPIAVSADGQYSMEFVECLASCGTAPVAMVNDAFKESVSLENAAELLGVTRSDATLPKIQPPHAREKRLVFKNIDVAGYTPDIECYLRHGGYEQLKKAFTMKPEDITEEVKKSGLRGRGGAGFPCGVKWSFIKRGAKPTYLICNADESEPGTFKDRYIIHQDPHQMLEGMIISCFAVGASLAYIYIRGEFPEGAQILEKALAEARAKGFLGKNIQGSGFDCDIYVHRGAGAYICGEETGLIESLEGKRAYPRIKPPYFPAVLGLYMSPTIVNNVETLCNVKHILAMGGGAEYAKLGKPNNTGTRILCVSGDVERPGYYEVEVGSLTMGELINEVCGGVKGGRKLKAVIPGGSSAKVMRADEKYKVKDRELTLDDIPMDFDTIAACGSMAGSGGVIVMDDTRDMVWALNNLNEFYAHESCGQCTPCREGAQWMRKITDRILAGGGTEKDPATLKTVADNIAGKTICAFGEACSWPTQSFLAKFPEEFAGKSQKPLPPPMPPEYNPRELVENPVVPAVPAPRGNSQEIMAEAATE